MLKKILIVDDDVELCALMKKCLVKEGFEVDVSHTGTGGLLKVTEGSRDYCLLILDVLLPNIDGFQVLAEVRKTIKVPVLMLTAKGDETDKVKGLRLGADDYLTKPFSINELMARVQSLVRRYTVFNESGAPEMIAFKNMKIDQKSRTVVVNGKSIELTGKEFDLLSFLAANKGRVFTKRQIYNQVWDENYVFDDNNIMSFISKLRKKIEPDAENPFYILTVYGVGYRFNKEA